jgi:hypothetical protein
MRSENTAMHVQRIGGSVNLRIIPSEDPNAAIEINFEEPMFAAQLGFALMRTAKLIIEGEPDTNLDAEIANLLGEADEGT